ncbi:hypothetical protein JAAARDRAFT_42081 [Jaapia argillacea MUCL 33604]|uniref:ER-bound oxygenase mpaB/mpaB'/Rubber oxygenase catalytic domain-containing protein n=1 Tax=Jaapia argillacea MUCL 33604 TaxID=933084 RepID=A0A067P6C1_9AGAM|nr:hypothetical protein JAAARDRAFT_42081 [Jaapia argillacea MUCL 33604]
MHFNLLPALDYLWKVEQAKIAVPVTAIITYLGLVQLLRWRRYHRVHEKYGPKLGSLTPAEAQTILHLSSQWDLPGINQGALSFALFKTYAIPTVSKLLTQTQQLGTKENLTRRYADTAILISTWIICPVAGTFDLEAKPTEPGAKTVELDPRCALAVARTNWLHSKYNISNDDYLYTLSLFILEPIRWFKRYGWRALSPLEEQAYLVYWSEIGRRMGIRDIPESVPDLLSWSEQYEEVAMIPATTNRDMANITMGELLAKIPNKFGLKAFFRRIYICLLDERVRIAMMQPAQPWYLHSLVRTVLHSFAIFQGHFCLPRLSPHRLVSIGPPSPSDGPAPRLRPTKYPSKPWYKPPSKGLRAFLERLGTFFGIIDPENVPGPKFKCEGYRIEELGPIRWETCR